MKVLALAPADLGKCAGCGQDCCNCPLCIHVKGEPNICHDCKEAKWRGVKSRESKRAYREG